jgi:ADP-heptose:LPS heptosyltransferase
MNNKVIYFLETHLGWLLCLLMDVFEKTIRLFSSTPSEHKAGQKVLFVKFIEQGALVLHRPAFAEAMSKYGQENVFICTFSSNAELLRLMNQFSPENLLLIDDKKLSGFIKDYFLSLKKIRQLNIDSVIDLEFFSRATALFCYMTGAEKRAGYHRFDGLQNYRGNLFTHRLSYSHYVHVADSSLHLLRCLDLPKDTLPTFDQNQPSLLPLPRFTATAQDINDLIQLTGIHDFAESKLIIINPSLNDQLPLRQWPAENYLALIARLQKNYTDHTIVLTGRKDEFEPTEVFASKLDKSKTINLCGKTTFRQLLALYSVSKAMVTSDSGPAHFASLTDLPTVVLFGPETPELYGPTSQNALTIYLRLPCSPCFNVYNNRLSPCTNNLCMKNISVDSVAKSLYSLLDQSTVCKSN